MAEYTDERLGLRLTVPDRLTVRQQLEYRGLIGFSTRADAYPRFWDGARHLIEEWECEAMPDKNVSIDEMDDPRVADIIFAACNIVNGHLNKLEAEAVPKNS